VHSIDNYSKYFTVAINNVASGNMNVSIRNDKTAI
jgi:hypothetical protein